jgi:hypothetical protein
LVEPGTPKAGLFSPVPETSKKETTKGAKPKLESTAVLDTPTPKKRINREAEEDLAADGSPNTTPNKKRATAKGKGKTKVKVEADQDVFTRPEDGYPAMDMLLATPPKTSTHPDPKSKLQTPNTALKKAMARTLVSGTEIPKSYGEAGEADRLLWDMKASGATWEEIRVAYAEASGKPIGGKSSLPNRYDRLKSNFTQIKEDHVSCSVDDTEAIPTDIPIRLLCLSSSRTVWRRILSRRNGPSVQTSFKTSMKLQSIPPKLWRSCTRSWRRRVGFKRAN